MFLGSQPQDFKSSNYPDLWFQSPYKTHSGEPILTIRTSKDADNPLYWLKYEEGTDVFVGERNSKIWVTWAADSCFEDAGTFLMGSVMAIVAQLRGSTCLHGCAIVVDGAIIALLGPQGAGKSTSAAAFANAGYPVAADDLILISEGLDGPTVEPTYPVVRLWPSSVESLFGHEDALPRITEGWDKRWLNLNEGGFRFQKEPLPLAALYILSERTSDKSAPFITALSGAGAIIELIANSWAHYVAKPAFLANQLRTLTRVSQCTPIRKIIPHSDITRLPNLCSLIVRDVRDIRAASCGLVSRK